MADPVWLKQLNAEQKEAVTFGEGPLLIVAGAGTGKTTVITQRVAWLIAQGKAQAHEILAVTFTDKAALEMEERIDRLLPIGYLDLWIMTFHAFCQRVLSEHAIDIGLPSHFTLLDSTAQWLLVRQHLDRFQLQYYRPMGNPTKFIHALLRHFSRAKDEAISPEEYLAFVEEQRLNQDSAEATGSALSAEGGLELDRLEEVAHAYHVYQQILLEHNALDFGDLVNYTLRLFSTRPHILEQYRKQFRYILVDEFQDTNWAQYELIKLLAAPRNNITVVGDDEQSIYKFRGASLSNILQFHSDFPDTRFISITTNYRSRQEVLDASYVFIQANNPNRLEAQSLHGKKISKKLTAARGGGAEISYLLFPDHYAEAAGVADKIISLHENGDEDGSGTVPSWNDFAILVRANSQADVFAQELERRGIPYQFVASRGLYTKRIVLDVINFMKLLDDYHESPSLWRVLNWPVFSFSLRTLTGMSHFAKKKALSLYQALHLFAQGGGEARAISEDERQEMRKVIALIEKYSRVAQERRVREVVLGFLEESGYLKHISRQENAQSHQEIEYLTQFEKKMRAFESSVPDPTVKLFLEEIQMEIDSGEQGQLEVDVESGPEAVKIMTIHSAKGLEFRYVFIVQMVDRRFPSIERRDPIELPDALVKETTPEGDVHLQEERRLLYVAMTRARDKLFFTGARDYGGKAKKKPSRFLYELGLVDQAQEGPPSSFSEPHARPHSGKDAAPYDLPSRFSYTQLRAFYTCPYQYRFAHILRVPVRANYTLSFGKTMHAVLRRFLEMVRERSGKVQQDLFGAASQESTKGLPPVEEVFALYEEEWIDEWYENQKQMEAYREKGRNIIKRFYERVAEQPPAVRYLEQGFHLKMRDPSSGDVYTIFGVIDRIDETEGGGVEIIDYKTGEAKNEKTIDKDQLLIYQIAAQEVLGLKPQRLTYYYLEDQKPVSFLGSEEEIANMKKRILDFIEQVKKSDFRPTPSPRHCRYCDYRNICEYRM